MASFFSRFCLIRFFFIVERENPRQKKLKRFEPQDSIAVQTIVFFPIVAVASWEELDALRCLPVFRCGCVFTGFS